MTDVFNLPGFDPDEALTNPTRSLTGPSYIRAATPYDSNYPVYATWIYIGQAGDVNIKFWDGTTVLIKNMQLGLYPIHSLAVLSSGTTADNILIGN